jgi:hypothetical protein
MDYSISPDGKKLKLPAETDYKVLEGVDAEVVLAIRHKDYLNLYPDAVIAMIGEPAALLTVSGFLMMPRSKSISSLAVRSRD